jgi:streptogramin lyase
MRYRLLRSLFIVGTAAIVAACSGGGAPPVPIAPAPQTPPNNVPTLQVGPYTATFKEVALPAGQSGPGDITVGPDGAVWFTVAAGGIDRIKATDVITPFLSPQIGSVFLGIASLNGSLWFAADSPPLPQVPTEYIVRQRTIGSATLADTLPADTFNVRQIIAARDGNLWATFENPTAAGVEGYDNTGHLRVDVGLPFNYTPQGLAAGTDGNVYVSAFGDLAQPDSAVFQISRTGTIVKQFNLPSGSNPNGIVVGPDGALWIALNGTNSIGRLTTGGTLTQFPLPTANAVPTEIIKGTDGALWFTEELGNAIGRITTSGSITEYTVPTPNAHPFGITTCPQQCENAHGRIWFTEAAANKVAKFEF